jgi:hypothetical protein
VISSGPKSIFDLQSASGFSSGRAKGRVNEKAIAMAFQRRSPLFWRECDQKVVCGRGDRVVLQVTSKLVEIHVVNKRAQKPSLSSDQVAHVT